MLASIEASVVRPVAAAASTSSLKMISVSSFCTPSRAERAKRPSRRAAQPDGVGAQRQGLQDVAAAPEAAVDHHRDLPFTAATISGSTSSVDGP